MELIFEHIEYDLESLGQRIPLRQCDRKRLEAISTDKRKCEWLTSRVLIWERYAKYIDMRSDGAPMIDGAYISISHCEDYIAIIIDHKPVGIDIENRQRNAARVSRKFTDETELAIVERYFPENPALFIWCAKEALYKLAGVEGAEFKSAFRIMGIEDDGVEASVFGERVRMTFLIKGDILCLFC